MNLYYHNLYTNGIHKESTFPRERYVLIYNELKSFKNNINFLEPPKAQLVDIYKAHSKNYVDNFTSGNLSPNEIRKIGLKPWTNDIVDRTLLITGGSLKALEDIYNGEQIAGNLAGGTHHAFYDRGSGFCIFNDIAICALKAIDFYGYKKILIIDLDVHQGDGTAEILKNRDEIFTFSMHCGKNFPFKKTKSNLDIEVRENCNDENYLEILSNTLNKIYSFDSEIIFFQAGVDVLKEDRYGKINLTLDGIEKRNKMIYNFAKKKLNPIIIFMGGGYSRPINFTVNAFKNLFYQASLYGF